MKRVLVTGALGYLGGRILRSLLDAGGKFEPVVGTLVSVSEIEMLKISEKLEARVVDVTRPIDELAAALKGIDSVVHLGALNEIQCAADPRQAMMVNCLGTHNLVDAAVKSGVQDFLFFSTAHVYGSPLVGVIEETRACRPVHPYAYSKRAAEDYVFSARDKGSINGIVVRLSNGMGAPLHSAIDRWVLVVNDLCRQAIECGKLTLKSSGKQQRNFIPIKDIGIAVNHLLSIPKTATLDGLFNLGGRENLSVMEIAEMVASEGKKILGIEIPIICGAPDANQNFVPLDYRSEKIRQTGLNLTGTVREAVAETLLFCREHFQKRS